MSVKSQSSFKSSNTGISGPINLQTSAGFNPHIQEGPVITEEDEYEVFDDLHLDLVRGSEPTQNQQIGDIKTQISKIKEILNSKYELHKEAKEKQKEIKEQKEKARHLRELISYLD